MSKKTFKVVYKNTGTIENQEKTLEIGDLAIIKGRHDPYVMGGVSEQDGSVTIGAEEFSFLAQLALFALQSPGESAPSHQEVNSWLEGYRAGTSRVRKARSRPLSPDTQSQQ
ncbi:hypothetical protein [Komagataeibacter medellinensis]|uniref:hypothetical protein n=1 Tax=Komagataeibacter medellinensis TaxID=1177712 RepID=UPI0012960D4B|nr:hypothetical protein [Komagataeibacter medellinensis]